MQTAASTDGLTRPEQIFSDDLTSLDSPCTWDVHLIKSHPEKRLGILLVALMTFICALVLFHQILVALLAVGAVLAPVAEFLLPLRYTLDHQGAAVSCGPITWLAMPWHDVQSIYRIANGVKISPFRQPRTAWLEPLRGILLRCPIDQLPNVLSRAQTLRAQAAEAVL